MSNNLIFLTKIVKILKSKMAYWRHFESRKYAITRLRIIWSSTNYASGHRSTVGTNLNFWQLLQKFYNPRWCMAVIWNSKTRNNSAADRQIFTKFCLWVEKWAIIWIFDKNCENLKSKMADGRRFENWKYAITRLQIVWSSPNFLCGCRNRRKFEFLTNIVKN